MTEGESTNRGQSGLDRLALFLLAVFLVLLVAPTVLGFAGVDVYDPEEPEPAEPPKLTVLGIEGGAIDENRSSIGTVRVVVTNAGGGEIDPGELSATWVGNGSYDLAAGGADTSADGTFAVRPGNESSSSVVLRDHTDRAVLEFDVGTDDIEGAREVGQRLASGESATLTLVTSDGASVRLALSPDGRLPENGSVPL